MKTYRVTTLQEFVSKVCALTLDFGNVMLWWRGQADSNWKLAPGVFRCGNSKKEININARFRMKAKSRYANCPISDASFPWLFLMQHYRLPTRILDWTESPLIALYFAVENEKEDDKESVIWALKPSSLNSAQINRNNILSPGHPDLKRVFTEAFHLNEENADQRIVAIQTEQIDIRHLVQQSEFTIHGCATPMENLFESDKFLGKILVPSIAKKELRTMLNILGITRSYLFPDLENLSAELASQDFDYHTGSTDNTGNMPTASNQSVEN